MNEQNQSKSQVPQLNVADQCYREGCLRIPSATAKMAGAAPELYAALAMILRIGPRPWIPGKPRVSFEEWDTAIEAAERALLKTADQHVIVQPAPGEAYVERKKRRQRGRAPRDLA